MRVVASRCSAIKFDNFSYKQTEIDTRVNSAAANCLSRGTKINASGGHGEVASQFRFFDKSKQRKPVKASEKADRRMIGRRREQGGKEKGDLFRARTRVWLR